MKDKTLQLETAAEWVKEGDQVVMSADMNWAPMALLRQLVRQGVGSLRLVGVVGGGINFDFLIGAGAVASADTCHVGLEPITRQAPNYLRHVTQARIQMLDNT